MRLPLRLNSRDLARITVASLSILLASMLPAACARTGDTVGVSVSAINYTDQELNGYLFETPGVPGKVAGGEPVRPFGGGGIMCCYSLPTKWHPGIKVQLRYDWWQGADKPRKYVTKVFEVPPYPDGQVGTLWALFYQDGGVEVVSSDFAPGHEKWPGKINGGPTPTLEYRRKVWEEDYDHEASLLPYCKRLADGPSEKDLHAEWDHLVDRHEQEASEFAGPSDPKFRERIEREGKECAHSIQERLTAMESVKP
jgi:hypothetical protein